MSTWWIPMAISAVGSVVGASSQRQQNKNQASWNRYNAGMQYGVDSMNNMAGMQLGMMNAGMQVAAGKMNAGIALEVGKINATMERQAAQVNAQTSGQVAAYNASLIHATALYNDSLMEDELAQIWDAAELDLLLLDNQRAVERGGLEATQAASGTVMGQDSNADVIVGQETQAALDAFVVRHNADKAAGNVNNARAKGIWEANLSMQQVMWQGQMEGYVALKNADIRSKGIMANAYMGAWGSMANANIAAAGIMAQTSIQGMSNRLSSNMRYQAGMNNATIQYDQTNQQISNNLITGLFGAAGAGATNYYGMKATTFPSSNVPASTASRSASSLAASSNPAWERVLRSQMSQPGSSLFNA